MLNLPPNWTKEQILNKIQSEYMVSKRVMDPIKMRIAEDRKLVMDPERD